MHTHEYDALDQLHIGLAIIIALAYASIPFTSLRLLAAYLPRAAQIGGSLFFITCAITHLAIAAGFHDSHWMIANDAVQAASSITFIASLSRMVGFAMRRRDARNRKDE